MVVRSSTVSAAGRAFREVDVEDLDPTAIAVAGDHLVIVGRGVDRGELVMIDRTMGAITRFALGAGRSPLDVGVADIAGTQAVVVLEVDDADRARVRAIDRGGAAIGVSVALPASWVGRCDGTVERWPRRRCGDPKVRRFGLRLPARPRRRKGHQAGWPLVPSLIHARSMRWRRDSSSSASVEATLPSG